MNKFLIVLIAATLTACGGGDPEKNDVVGIASTSVAPAAQMSVSTSGQFAGALVQGTTTTQIECVGFNPETPPSIPGGPASPSALTTFAKVGFWSDKGIASLVFENATGTDLTSVFQPGTLKVKEEETALAATIKVSPRAVQVDFPSGLAATTASRMISLEGVTLSSAPVGGSVDMKLKWVTYTDGTAGDILAGQSTVTELANCYK